MPEPALSEVTHTRSNQVLARFAVRLLFLAVFTIFSSHGWTRTFASILALSAIYCVVCALIRGESVFGPVLTHWDEAAGYLLVNGVISHAA